MLLCAAQPSARAMFTVTFFAFKAIVTSPARRSPTRTRGRRKRSFEPWHKGGERKLQLAGNGARYSNGNTSVFPTSREKAKAHLADEY
jgi:hypothetical protein